MCLAVPVQILEHNNETNVAKVEINGVRLDVSTLLIEDIKPGDFGLLHAGYIIEKLTQEEVDEKMDAFSELYSKMKEAGHE